MNELTHFLEPGYQADLNRPAQVCLIPVPFGETTTWLSGTENGPREIFNASQALELFDDELLLDTWEIGIKSTSPVTWKTNTTESMLEAVCGETESVLQKGCLPILIGGEHTISIAGVAACLRHYPNLCVVQIDAHLDLRDEYNNQWLNHACTMRRIADFSVPFFQIGIRSFSKEEWYLCKSQKWSPWTQERIRNHPDWHDQLGKEIDERPVYLTFDFDSLDPAVLPATGTPEPDGLSWRSATHLLHYLCSHTNIIGADFVEFSPAVGPAYGAFTAAKLIYRTIGYIFSNRIKLTEEENDN